MISVELLRAERGDAILIEYGHGADPTHRVLIDGGPVNSGLYAGVRDRLAQIPAGADGRRHFDLLIVTHVDADHIEGVLRLLQDRELACVFDDTWFNGWKHIEPLEPGATVSMLGPAQGAFLGALLTAQGRPWNRYFGGGAVFVDDTTLPSCRLRGGLVMTVLSPMLDDLRQLARQWDVAVRAAGFNPGNDEAALAQLQAKWWARPPELGPDERIQASADRSAANGSSIAVLAEWDGRRIVLTGDAHDDVLTAGLRLLRADRGVTGPLRLDAFKLSHHGGEHNTTPQLLAEIAADHYLVSTSGDRYRHPDALAITMVIDHHRGDRDPVLCFNYRQPQTVLWQGKQGVETRYEDAAVLRFR